MIDAWDNVPVLSWLLLWGRCRGCREPISVRYPLVEAGTGLGFAVVAWWAVTVDRPGLLPVVLYLVAVGIALAMIDIDCFRLPDVLVLPSYPVVAAGLGVCWWIDGDLAVGRVLLGGLVWLLAIGVPWFVTAGRGMGFGDVKLAPLLGAVLGVIGWGAVLVGLMAAFILGAVVGLLMQGRARRRMADPEPEPESVRVMGARAVETEACAEVEAPDEVAAPGVSVEQGVPQSVQAGGNRLPFGPFLLAGALVGLLAGQGLGAAYLRLFGLA